VGVVLQGGAHNFMFKNNILHESLQALREDVMLKLYLPLSSLCSALFLNEKATALRSIRQI
jgi:hypothetical protein